MSAGDRLRLLLASSGGLGLAPVAPGTFGTLGGVLIAWALSGTQWFLGWTLLTCALLYILGRPLGAWAEAYARGKDPQFYVVDEVIGYLITVAWIGGPSPVALAVAFCVFRVFDVTKPPPARRMEALGGGDGILLDDVVAGVYGLGVMALARTFIGDAGLWTVAQDLTGAGA